MHFDLLILILKEFSAFHDFLNCLFFVRLVVMWNVLVNFSYINNDTRHQRGYRVHTENESTNPSNCYPGKYHLGSYATSCLFLVAMEKNISC